MKKYFLAIIAAMLLAMPAMAQTKQGKTLEVSFNYQKQAGSVMLTSKLSEPDETHMDMITDVKAVIK